MEVVLVTHVMTTPSCQATTHNKKFSSPGCAALVFLLTPLWPNSGMTPLFRIPSNGRQTVFLGRWKGGVNVRHFLLLFFFGNTAAKLTFLAAIRILLFLSTLICAPENTQPRNNHSPRCVRCICTCCLPTPPGLRKERFHYKRSRTLTCDTRALVTGADFANVFFSFHFGALCSFRWTLAFFFIFSAGAFFPCSLHFFSGFNLHFFFCNFGPSELHFHPLPGYNFDID